MKRSLLFLCLVLIVALVYMSTKKESSKLPCRTHTYKEQVTRHGEYDEMFFYDDGQKVATLRVEVFGSYQTSTPITNVGESLKGKLLSWTDIVAIAKPRLEEVIPSITNKRTEAVAVSSPLYGGATRIFIFESSN